MKLEITFENADKNDQIKIYYELLNNTVVTKFIELINNINSNKIVKAQYNNFCINTGNLEEIINERYNNLVENIRLFEEENNNNYLFTNKFDLIDISQERLNALHTEFETYLVIFGSSLLTNECNNLKKVLLNNPYNRDNIIKYLNCINCLIHNLESIISVGDKRTVSTGFFSTYLYSEPYFSPVKLEDDEYSLFTVDIRWGDLLLGYGTTGKSLYHIFKDSDIQLLRDGFNLSPEQYVTSNIMGMFSETEEDHNEKFAKWCIENRIKEEYGIDYEDRKNSSGYIKMGDLISQDNREDFLLKLSNYPNIIGYRIIE